MVKRKWTILTIEGIIILLLCFSINLKSQTPANENPLLIDVADLNSTELGKYLFILEDTTNLLSLEEVKARAGEFVKSEVEVPNLGITNSSFWVKFSLKNKSLDSKFLLELAYPLFDEVKFYAPGNEAITLGELYPFSDREYNYPSFVFDVELEPNSSQTYYLKLKNKEQLQVPLYIGSPSKIIEGLTFKQLISSTFFGIILVMLLYNLFVYFAVREKNYLYYVIYILVVGLTQLMAQGFTFQYLWPNAPWLASHSIFLLPALSGHAVIEFARKYMRVRLYLPKLNKALLGLHFIYGFTIVMGIFGQFAISYNLTNLAAMIAIILMMAAATIITRKGYRPARFFLTAWSVFLVGVFIFILKDAGVLPFNNFTNYTMLIGVAIETILLSFGLADQINIMMKEKEESQAKAFEALKENERIVKEQNVELEKRVKIRTMELQESNEELESTLSNLKETQSQLVDAEKMASLGQLTAGIAHEINNPINFVTSNVAPLRRDLSEIYEIVDTYSAVNVENVKETLEKAHDLRVEYDFDFLKEEIDTLVSGISDGAIRTQEIVQGLKTFSRLDEDDVKLIDITEGLDSTLVILRSKTKDQVIIEKEYNEEIPMIECFPGKLNQVFMNILNNALYAVENKTYADGEKPTITLKTVKANNQVNIHLMDNGIGMDENTKKKLFEPFFTTKDVGEGTGLGMSIVFKIIEKHQGKIQLNSELGKGSEFIITLPLHQPKDS